MKIKSSITVILLVIAGLWFSANAGILDGLLSVGKQVVDGVAKIHSTSSSSPQNQVKADAWLNGGKAGKALVVTDAALGIIGSVAKKDVSNIRKNINEATAAFMKEESFQQNEVRNYIGGVGAVGMALKNEHEDQKIDRLTNPNNPNYNPEVALRVDYVDYENHKIIYKSDSQYYQDLAEYRKQKKNKWISENIGSSCGITIEEYENLSHQDRVNADLALLNEFERSQEPQNSFTSSDSCANQSELQVISEVNLSDIQVDGYALNVVDLTSEQVNQLNKVVDLMNQSEALSIIIVGHTCSLGKDKVNRRIGLQRAEKAKDYLIQNGIEDNRVDIESQGSSNPIDTNTTPEGRQHNRRLTFMAN